MSTTKPRLTSDAPVQLDAGRTLDWARILVVFLRALALLSLARGLGHWGIICGLRLVDGLGFEELPPGFQAATIFFGVMELVAGVGLWLASAWGAVVWIIVAMAALVIDVAVLFGMQGWMQSVARPELATLADAALLGFYIVAANKAARQADEAEAGN